MTIVVRTSFDSLTLRRPYAYTALLPDGYENSDRRYPIIYLLHGRGETSASWLTIEPTFTALTACGDIPPTIAILPDVPSSERASFYVDSQYTGERYPAEAVETAFIRDLLPHIDNHYRARTQREARFVGGYSMGGYGALRYALAYPHLFGGALVLSPAVFNPLPTAKSSAVQYGAFGKGATLFDPAIYMSLNYSQLIDGFVASNLRMTFFVAVGAHEGKHPDFADRLHDLDMETHLVFNRLVRVPNIQIDFRVYGGGHDWGVWEAGFVEGIKFLFQSINSGSGVENG